MHLPANLKYVNNNIINNNNNNNNNFMYRVSMFSNFSVPKG